MDRIAAMDAMQAQLGEALQAAESSRAALDQKAAELDRVAALAAQVGRLCCCHRGNNIPGSKREPTSVLLGVCARGVWSVQVR